MKKSFVIWVPVLAVLMMVLACCGTGVNEPLQNAVTIECSDSVIYVDGTPIGVDEAEAVYRAKDIVYYEAGRDFTYGEGAEKDAHSAEDAAAHTVVHITRAGTYSLSGVLSRGQIAVDLGENAKKDPKAVVTLILNGLDITCEVAPAIIFYNVYECENDDKDSASMNVDTGNAGANVVIADGTENTVNGSYVAKIYKPGSAVLNKEQSAVKDAKKLHKYDAAFYSRMTMNVNGGKEGSGILNIHAENEGLDTELHLTVNGGNINIYSGNDGINTNEDGVSVTTVNGGNLTVTVTGETGEGDGIDSNGWLVINGGNVIASACSESMDAGIDSDMGIHINGGTVFATGHMLDRIEDSDQNHAVFQLSEEQSGNEMLCLKDENGEKLLEIAPGNAYSVVVFSSPDMTEGTYSLWSNDYQLAVQRGAEMGGPGMPGPKPGDMEPPKGDEDMAPPPKFDHGSPPEGMPRDKK